MGSGFGRGSFLPRGIDGVASDQPQAKRIFRSNQDSKNQGAQDEVVQGSASFNATRAVRERGSSCGTIFRLGPLPSAGLGPGPGALSSRTRAGGACKMRVPSFTGDRPHEPDVRTQARRLQPCRPAARGTLATRPPALLGPIFTRLSPFRVFPDASVIENPAGKPERIIFKSALLVQLVLEGLARPDHASWDRV